MDAIVRLDRRARPRRRGGAGGAARVHRLAPLPPRLPGVRGVRLLPALATSRCSQAAPLIHGADERIDVRDLAFATEMFRDSRCACWAEAHNRTLDSGRGWRILSNGPWMAAAGERDGQVRTGPAENTATGRTHGGRKGDAAGPRRGRWPPGASTAATAHARAAAQRIRTRPPPAQRSARAAIHTAQSVPPSGAGTDIARRSRSPELRRSAGSRSW